MRFYSLYFPNCCNIYFRLPRLQNTLYLTFDDCSNVSLTSELLDLLNDYNISATFFCIGEILAKNLFLIDKILKNHTLGNHTFSHYNFLKTDITTYITDIFRFQSLYKANLFRPPYGVITPSFAKRLKKYDLKVVLWSLMTYDFDVYMNADRILKLVYNRSKNGTIIVFHCNDKVKKLLTLIEKTIVFFTDKNFVFDSIKI